MKYCFGIDNVICHTEGTNYADAKPIKKSIEKVNKLFDRGCHIVYLSSRGFDGEKGVINTILTYEQLQAWGCKYTSILLVNPVDGIYTNTNVYTPDAFLKLEI